MGDAREGVALWISAPLMLGGLAIAALATSWTPRLGAAGMVVGSALALAFASRWPRRVGWAVALLSAATVFVDWGGAAHH